MVCCYILNSSIFVYETNITDENISKSLSYQTLQTEQYEAYIDSLYDPILTFTGELTGYGADCEGCSGILACKPLTNVFEKGIYFEDKEYGTVRIVAASRDYKCGTIVRFNAPKLSDEPIIAVVMDRGGAIQDNKLDLLTESESYSAKYVGRVKNLEVEVLREGW